MPRRRYARHGHFYAGKHAECKATKYCIEDKNGTILSEDGTRKFIVLAGQKLHDYLQTEEGKQKRFFVYEDNGEVIGIEEMPNTTKRGNP